jgi:putative ABC transport system ATP-binding protein
MLRASSLSRRSAKGTALLAGVSLELSPGERLALVGPSGAGKSVLLRALALLDPVEGGRVTWNDAAPHGDRIPAFRRRVHYLQQTPLVTDDRVDSQLALPWSFASARGAEFDRDRAAALLGATGRGPEFLERRGTNLSGGESQLLALIRALLLECSVLLLDEPTSAMDAVTKAAAESLLEEWIESDSERAWIWVSHDDAQLDRTCRRRVLMQRGEVVA